MALPVNDKKGNNKLQNNNKNSNNSQSKFIKPTSKSAMAPKKVRSTGANRGS